MTDIKCAMNQDEIRYAIAKQTSSMQCIQTNYGDIELDDELSHAVQEAIERILYKRICERPPIDALSIELADVQREALDEMVTMTGVSDDSLAQAMFDYGFEAMDGMARMMNP